MSEIQNIPTDVTKEPAERSRPRWGRILAWAAVLGLLVLVFFGLRKTQGVATQIGSQAPTFDITSFDGARYTSENMRGKVVVINFWASWCKPCEQEAPDLEQAWKYYESRGDVVFLGVAWTDTDEGSLAYMQKFSVTYPNGPDLGTRLSQKYRITGVPETYIIDQNGVLVYKKLAPFESVQEIQSAIDPLLGN